MFVQETSVQTFKFPFVLLLLSSCCVISIAVARNGVKSNLFFLLFYVWGLPESRKSEWVSEGKFQTKKLYIIKIIIITIIYTTLNF